MTTLVRIPATLRRYTAGRDEVPAMGRTVAEVIADLEKNHPGLRDCVLDGQGVRRFVNVYLGEDDIRFLNGLDTELEPGDTLTIVPAIAGG